MSSDLGYSHATRSQSEHGEGPFSVLYLGERIKLNHVVS
jgi:hypothetical protein